MTMISRIMRACGALGLAALLAGCVAPTPYGAVAPVQPGYTDAVPYYAPEPYYDAGYPAYYDSYPYGVASVGISVYGDRYYDDYRYDRKRSGKRHRGHRADRHRDGKRQGKGGRYRDGDRGKHDGKGGRHRDGDRGKRPERPRSGDRDRNRADVDYRARRIAAQQRRQAETRASMNAGEVNGVDIPRGVGSPRSERRRAASARTARRTRNGR